MARIYTDFGHIPGLIITARVQLWKHPRRVKNAFFIKHITPLNPRCGDDEIGRGMGHRLHLSTRNRIRMIGVPLVGIGVECGDQLIIRDDL